MAWLVGIDIGHQNVRVALLRTGYRRIAIESVQERNLADFASLDDAIRATVPSPNTRTESVATNLEGDQAFIRVLDLPQTAQRQLAEVLPFELEAQIPFDLDQTVFDTRQLPRQSTIDPLRVLAAVARTVDVRERIDLIRRALGLEPERVEPECISLGNLALAVPELQAQGTTAVMHLDSNVTDVVFLRSGQVHFARTLSVGTADLPASAQSLIREIKQTIFSWRATGLDAPTTIYLTGPGALLPGADTYLSAELALPVCPLPALRLDGLTPDMIPQLMRCSKAIALALGLAPRSRGLNLRRGALAYERGYAFLREKVPLLAGLGAVIAASFLFSAWTEAHTLSNQKETLEDALGMITRSVMGEAIRDPQKATDMIGPGVSGADDDPMPHMDAFDVMVQLSKAVPAEVTHDVEELDVQRGHVTINGVVPTTHDGEQIATSLKSVSCFRNVKLVRFTQAINENKQKYVLEFDIKCPGEGQDKDKDKEKDKDKKTTPSEAASSEAVEKAGDKR